VTVVLAPIAATLLGYGVLRWLRPGWPAFALLGAAMASGPALATLVIFLAVAVGLPYGTSLAYGVLLLGCALTASAWIRRPAGDLTGAVPASVAGSFVLVDLVLNWFATPGPFGDGLNNFGVKARAFHALGEPFAFLSDERLYAIHPDYPLQQPYVRCLGYLFDGTTSSLAGLSGNLLVVPGVVLFLVAMAARNGSLAAWLLAGIAGLLPALRSYLNAGYSDPHLAAVLALAVVGLVTARRGFLASAVLAGLLPWIKLEGAALLAILCVLAMFRPWPSRRVRVTWVAVAGAVGCIWPVTLLLTGIGRNVTEHADIAADGEYVGHLLSCFVQPIVATGSPHFLILVPCLLAAVCALVDGDSERRRGALMLLAFVLAYPAMTLLRRSAPMQLEEIAVRLTSHWIPLGIWVLANEASVAMRGLAVFSRR